MKKIAIDIHDLINVLEAMRDSGGTNEVIIFEVDGMPALADKDNPDDIIQFQIYDKEQETKDGDSIH